MFVDYQLNNKSGVYKIVCSTNQKFYIGSAANLYKRLYNHLLMFYGKKHDNIHLQRAWNKYGADSFKIEVIEFCSHDIVKEREQYYITEMGAYEKGFNLQPIVMGGFPGKSITLKHLNSGVLKTWPSRIKAAKEIGCVPSGITNISKGKFCSIKGWGLPSTTIYGSGGHHHLSYAKCK